VAACAEERLLVLCTRADNWHDADEWHCLKNRCSSMQLACCSTAESLAFQIQHSCMRACLHTTSLPHQHKVRSLHKQCLPRPCDP
jgi:hypothetical protein